MILVDTGSIHNFVDPSVVRGAQLAYNDQNSLQVKVANGETVYGEGSIEAVPLLMQGNIYSIEFYILTLGGCDVVLGVHWLRTLGPILWDFTKLQMEFTWLGMQQKLQGMVTNGSACIELIEGHDFGKASRQNKRGIVLQLINLEQSELWSIDSPRNPIIDNLLQKYSEIFCVINQTIE